MQFDASQGSGRNAANWQTNHDVIEQAYKEAGYEMPQIVYWDLARRTRRTMEVEATRQGVAMMHGFSASMMKVFLGEDVEGANGDKKVRKRKEFNPVNVMKMKSGLVPARVKLVFT